MRDLVTVSIFTSLRDGKAHKGDVVIDPRVVGCNYESQPYGWGRGRVGLAPDGYKGVYPALSERVDVPEDAHVEFRLGGSLLYEGVAINATETGFECEGYGLWATKYGSVDASGDTPVTSGVIVREAINAVPWLEPGEIVDAGVYHDWSEIRHRKPSVVIDQMTSEGDGSTPWMFRVYGGRLAHYTPKVPKDTPDLVLSYDPETMQIPRAYNRIDGVRIVYRDPSGVERVWPEGGMVYTRAGIVANEPYLKVELLTGAASANGAIATAMTYLAKHSTIGISGTAVFTGWQHLETLYGDTFLLRGYGEGDGEGIVERTNVDLFSGVTQMVLGEPTLASAPGFLNALAATVFAGQNKVDPITKAKAV